MGELAAVDVARGDLGVTDVVARERERGAVERGAGDALEGAGVLGVEDDDLPARGRRALGVGRSLAVHPHVRRRLLDEAVRLARHHERVLGEPDVERLTAAAQRQEQLIGSGVHLRADRQRSVERGDGGAERLVRVVTGSNAPGHERGNHLRVGGDLRRELEALHRGEVGEVVDVAVERADHVGRGTAAGLLLVERVRVRLGDAADARPPGVPEHDRLGGLRREDAPQELVVADRRPQLRGVVAELTDLGGRLVHERQAVRRHPHRPRGEQRIGGAGDEQLAHVAGVEIEVVLAHEHVQPGGVAAADLEAVERRERDVDRDVGVDRHVGSRLERGDRLGGAETVVANGPDRVAGPDQRRVDQLDLRRAHRRRGTEVEVAFDRVELEPEGTEPVVEHGRDVRRAEQRAHAGGAAQRRVDGRDQRRGAAEPVAQRGVRVEDRERFDQVGRERRRVGRGSPSAASDDAHNATHSE